VCDRPTLRVLPCEAEAFPGAGHALLYAHGVVPELDTVQLDAAHGPEFMHTEAQLRKYRTHLDWMDKATLSAEDSQEFIHDIARQL
jgi:hypothetical protein